jgi:glycosyltransferase involved in cell wall biosynthesis
MRIAVLIPCFNEAVTIDRVVRDARRALPRAQIVVGDNNSTDGTAALAQAAGARVIAERRQGKGAMVRRLFRDVEADWYVLVDGDATYDLGAAPQMIEQGERDGVDFVNGVRVAGARDAFRKGHAWGNKVLTGSVALIFGSGVEDMLSGFKVLSRRFVKSFPALATGFDLETDLAVHALECGLPVRCVPTRYDQRPQGSHSKLSTFRDGWRIARLILALIRHERPMMFFSAIAVLFAGASALLMTPVWLVYVHTGLVPRLPTAILSMGLMLAAGASLLAGIIGESVTRGRRELRMLAFLSQSAPWVSQRRAWHEAA